MLHQTDLHQDSGRRACRNDWCKKPFTVTAEHLAFYEKASPEFNGKKELIPPPTRCPDCRLQRRLAQRNHIYVYRRPSSLTGATLFSMYPEYVPFPVIENSTWFSERNPGLDFGRDCDMSRPVFEQLKELKDAVPHFALSVLYMENSDYVNNASYVKNSYFVLNTSYTEDCMYSEMVWWSKDCVECTQTYRSELCYDCVLCMRCYNLQSSEFSENCSDSYFLTHCIGCKNCFGCANLQYAEYCMFNEQLTKEEYEQRLAAFHLESYTERAAVSSRVQEFWKLNPRPHQHAKMAEGCTGEFIESCRNVQSGFFMEDAENVSFGLDLRQAVRDCMDFSIYGAGAELIYESAVCGDRVYQLAFCNDCWDGSVRLLYCQSCIGCQDCFGCAGLWKKKYCIFNRQYSAEDYARIVPTLIAHMRATGEWGEFFAVEMTSFGYNHSFAQRFFPLTKAEAVERGYLWYEAPQEAGNDGLTLAELPDGHPASDDSIITSSIRSGRAFKVTSQEIKRYRQLRVPLPRLTYDERMEDRAAILGGIHLYTRSCAKTGKELQTTIKPSLPWIVWERTEWEREFRG